MRCSGVGLILSLTCLRPHLCKVAGKRRRIYNQTPSVSTSRSFGASAPGHPWHLQASGGRRTCHLSQTHLAEKHTTAPRAFFAVITIAAASTTSAKRAIHRFIHYFFSFPLYFLCRTYHPFFSSTYLFFITFHSLFSVPKLVNACNLSHPAPSIVLKRSLSYIAAPSLPAFPYLFSASLVFSPSLSLCALQFSYLCIVTFFSHIPKLLPSLSLPRSHFYRCIILTFSKRKFSSNKSFVMSIVLCLVHKVEHNCSLGGYSFPVISVVVF